MHNKCTRKKHWNNYQGRNQDFVRGGGGRSDKISKKVAKILVRSGDIKIKFTQQRLLKLLKIYIKIAHNL